MEGLVVIGIIVAIGIISSLFDESENADANYGTTSLTKRCSACGQIVSNSSSAGQSCPHCGAYWSTENSSYIN